jgi:hypothetical protein
MGSIFLLRKSSTWSLVSYLSNGYLKCHQASRILAAMLERLATGQPPPWRVEPAGHSQHAQVHHDGVRFAALRVGARVLGAERLPDTAPFCGVREFFWVRSPVLLLLLFLFIVCLFLVFLVRMWVSVSLAVRFIGADLCMK